MTIGTPLKIVLVLLISILWIAAGPAGALAGPAKFSFSPQGSGSMDRKISGASLSRSRNLSPNQAPGHLRRISAQSAVLAKNPTTKVISRGSVRDLTAPRSLRGHLAHLSRFSPPARKVSPPATPSAGRSLPNNLRDRILTEARSHLGIPYRSGGSLETDRATDCSGFVQSVYQKSHIDLPRNSAEQAQAGAVVSRTLDFAKLLPGDLLFFSSRSRHIGHVGIYLGDGQMIHASSHSRKVVISDLRDPYREGSFVVAKRLPEVQSSKY